MSTTAPTVTAPIAVALPAAITVPIPNVTITDAWAASNPGKLAVDLSCTAGELNVSTYPSARSMTLTGTLSQINSALKTLSYTTTSLATVDAIAWSIWDQAGRQYVQAPISIGIAPVTQPVKPPVQVSPPAQTVPPVQTARAHDFLASLGVNTHLDFGVSGATPQYADLQAVVMAVQGIWGTVPPLLRDSPGTPADVALWESFAKLCPGVRFISYIGECAPSAYAGYVTTALAMPPGLVAYLEGPNEPDTASVNNLTGGLTATQALQAAAAFMPTLAAHGLPVVDMSFGQGWTAANNWAGNYGSVGNLAADVSYANAHTYPGAGPPLAEIELLNKDAALAAPGRPIAHSEFGYSIAAVTQQQQAQYTLCGWCDAWLTGCPLFVLYALCDDMSGAWGLFNADWTPRPVATALANFRAILADTGATAATFEPGELEYSLLGCASFVLAFSDGTFGIVAWNEAAAAQNFPLTVQGAVTRFDPMAGVTGVVVPAGQVSVPGWPVVLRIA
jgi:serralysin